jgi:protein TonB
MTKREEVHGPTRILLRVTCSLAIHLGLGMIVVAGTAGLAPQQAPRVAWFDLEPADIPPPPSPTPPAAVSRPRAVRSPAVEPRKLPTPVAASVPDGPVAPPAQPLPSPPPREVAETEPPPTQGVLSPPQAQSVAVPTRPSEPDRSGAPSRAAPTSASAAADSRPSRESQERGTEGAGRPAVASRPPEAPVGGAIVGVARPRGGYQVRPVYPEAARRAGVQGTTLLRIHIEADGRVSDVTVERSAGHQGLDQAAAAAVRRWRFEPALNSAGAVSVWALVPVEFRISDRD